MGLPWAHSCVFMFVPLSQQIRGYIPLPKLLTLSPLEDLQSPVCGRREDTKWLQGFSPHNFPCLKLCHPFSISNFVSCF